METLLRSLFVANAAPTCNNFPSDSSLHAGCHMKVTFDQFQCSELENLMSAEITAWKDGDSCAASGYPGFYTLQLEDPGVCIRSTRLTANLQYTDSQIFSFTQLANGCQVTAQSQSQSLSMLDNCVNYCNMWNVFTGIGAFTLDNVSNCSETPSDPVSTCARY